MLDLAQLRQTGRSTQPAPHGIPASGAEQPPWISYFSAKWARHTVHPPQRLLTDSMTQSIQVVQKQYAWAQCMHSTYILSLGENTLLDSFPGPNLRLKTPNDATSLAAQWKPAQHIHLPLDGRTAPGKARAGRRFLGTNGATLWLWSCLPKPGAPGP